jgi:dephospho-CoA kinase
VKVAVTGGLGTGKSTVCKILSTTLETELVDTDDLCRLQMEPNTEGFEEFKRVFGDSFLQGDGTIDRIYLRQTVFADGALRGKLEKILHPIVRSQVVALGRAYSAQGKLLIVEVPLLYEVGWQDDFDVCVVVYVPEKICMQRVTARDELSAEQIEQIMNAQLPIKKKLEYAHFIVDNSGTFVSTVQQIAWLSRQLQSSKKIVY